MAEKRSWKTYTAAILGMLAGIVAMGKGIIGDPVNMDMIWGGITGFVASLSILGVGHKLQKLIDAVKK